jgi:hypothetical protein
MITPTVTIIPTPVAIAHVTAIEPASALNDQPRRITIVGAGFVDASYGVSIGERALTDVRVESATTLTGTLPAGVCPGAYPATVTDALGRQASGGSLQTLAVLSATWIGQDVVAPAITLVGHIQHVVVALPVVEIRDTTCATGDLHLQVSVSEFTHSGTFPSRLVPLSVEADSSGRHDNQPLALVSGRGTATLLIRRPDSSGLADIQLSGIIEVPSHPAAGDYRASVNVALKEASP